jgi:hypothetical protein
MSTVAAQLFSGTHRADPVHSSLQLDIELQLERDDEGGER